MVGFNCDSTVIMVPCFSYEGKNVGKKITWLQTYACNREINNSSVFPFLKQTAVYIYAVIILF
jgi:hypothetical protein